MNNKNQNVSNLIDRVSVAPWAAAIGLAVTMFLSPSGAFATINAFPSWEVTSEFNDSSNASAANPSGVWSYGCKPSEFGIFNLLGFSATNFAYTNGTFPDVSGWSTDSGYPLIWHNTHAVTLTGFGLFETIPPHALIMHPGPAGEHAVLRFTALARGTYKISGQFYAQDSNGSGTTTGVYIVKNNTGPVVYSANVNYLANVKFASFTSKVVSMNARDFIDFQVDYGTDFDYNFDSTGLNAVIEKIK